MQPGEDVLATIVAAKTVDVAARKRERPLAEVRRAAEPTSRSLRAALAAGGTRFILEHKRRSPSQGAIRTSVEPRSIALAYRGAADAISVLTDGPFFGGSFDDLRAVREVAEVPLLCKDFVIDPYQVVEARAHGADAVLLMLSVLSDPIAVECLDEARRLGMDAVVEVRDEAELRRALGLPSATILGINHRDLRTLAVDLGVSARLAPLIPPDRIVVAESGIDGRADIDRLAPYADAFLVGSSLMRAPDPRDAARSLVFGRVKVCGLTSIADARAVAAAGASIGGLVFAKESPRHVAFEVASNIAADAALPLAGVFVDADPIEVARTAYRLHLCAVQLHGREDAAYVRALRPLLPERCAVWKVAHVPRPAGADDRALDASDRLLFDTASAGVRGGTGRAFNWRILAGHPRLGESLLAGGIGADNAVAARAVGAWAIDVGSRLERSPGTKDPERVRAMFTLLRGPGRRRRGPDPMSLEKNPREVD